MRGRPFINKVEQNYFLVEESKYLTNFPLQNYWAALLPANLYIIFFVKNDIEVCGQFFKQGMSGLRWLCLLYQKLDIPHYLLQEPNPFYPF